MTLTGNQARTQYVILAPSGRETPSVFTNRSQDSREHSRLVTELQRFRGGIYAADGAISPSELTSDGRHKTTVDEQSWHILALNKSGRICASLRYLEESNATCLDDLWVRAAARIESGWNDFRRGIETEMARARELGLRFGEVGGWAVAEENRLTPEPLRILLAMYGLLELLGGCIGIATATVRHGSAAILRRVGLSPVSVNGADVKPYYDAHYQCHMELLRFNSGTPNPRYSTAVRTFSQSLQMVPVLCRSDIRETFRSVFHGFEGIAAQSQPSALVPALNPV